MATDNSPPRLKLIVTIAIITVLTLLSLNFVLTSYYGYMSDEAVRSKLAPTTDKYEQHKHEQAALALAGIDTAMKEVAAGNRKTMPEQSTDIAPMTGWSKLPHPPPPVTMAPHPPGGEMMMPAGDGGVMNAGAMHGHDGGAPHAMDGGMKPMAPKAPKN